MSRMSELHDDLGTIHRILLGQRKVAQDNANNFSFCASAEYRARVECIDNLLLEIEAAGVVWPDNVVELCKGWDSDTVTPSATADACPAPRLVKCTECDGQGRIRFIEGDCMHCGGHGKVQHD